MLHGGAAAKCERAEIEPKQNQNVCPYGTYRVAYRAGATLTPSESTSFEYGREADGTLACCRSGISGAANATCLRCDFFVMSTLVYGAWAGDELALLFFPADVRWS